MSLRLMTLLSFLLGALLGGCGTHSPKLDAKFAADRERLLLLDEPTEPVGILELRESGAVDKPVALFGKIGGSKGPTWSPGAAEFMLSDPTASIGDEHTADCKCLFCKNKKAKTPEPYAIVQFRDQVGNVLPVDARQLLSLEDSQTVVVKGQAQIDSLGNLVIAAQGIYVRR